MARVRPFNTRTFNLILKEKAVQVSLLAVGINIVLLQAVLGTYKFDLDFLFSIALFGLIMMYLTHFFSKKVIDPLNMFFLGFFGSFIFNQLVTLLNQSKGVPLMTDIVAAVQMGGIMFLLSHLMTQRGGRK